MTKQGIAAGDRLVLTKPIGTGAVLAAAMRGKARGRWLEAAVAAMLLTNAEGARILRSAGARACTDVTGFGLLGHLLELAGPVGARITLDLDGLPAIDGAIDCLAAGLRSTMHPKNAALVRRAGVSEQLTTHAKADLLFDPQTAGGLLAAVPAERADDCVGALVAAGYPDAAVIGQVGDTGRADGARLDAAG
jgi:selenide,water dikinase